MGRGGAYITPKGVFAMRFLRRCLAVSCAVALTAAVLLAVWALPGGPWRQVAATFWHDPRLAAVLWRDALAAPTPPATAAWRQQRATPTPRPLASPTPAKAAPTASPAPTAEPIPIPGEIRNPAPITPRQFGQGTGAGYVALAAGSIKNNTSNPDSALASAIEGALPFTVELDSAEPQVLILHTHATETYQTWDTLLYDPAFTARTRDNSVNMCAVGARMAEILNAAGVNTLHDETLHDDPSYTESYARSAQTTKQYLARYPSIKVVLDVHRDAIEADGSRIKPLCSVDGQDTAQVMIIAGCDNGGSVALPNWRLNLRFAAAWESEMERRTPGLTRPVLCGYRFYNQDLTTGSLLIEIGGHANTVEEALRGGTYAAQALAALFGAAE